MAGVRPSMHPSCPDPEDVRAYVDRRLDGAGTEALEAHLAACPSCRDLAVLLSRLGSRPASVPARRWWPAAAAAALLLGVLVLRSEGDGPRAPGPSPGTSTPRPAAASPFVDSSLPLGEAGSLALREGSRAEVLKGGPLPGVRLLAGTAWVENPGGACEILLPGGRIRLEQAILLVEVIQPPRLGNLFLRDACAAAASETRILVVEGSVVLHPDAGEPLALVGGQEAGLLPSGLKGPAPAGVPSWTGEPGWRHAEPRSSRLRDGALALPSLPGEPCWAWEALLRRTDPAASVALRFATGSQCWEMPLGASLMRAHGWVRVRVEARGGWVRVRVGTSEILREPVQALGLRLQAVGATPGLKVWGGDVEIRDLRWRVAG